MKKLIILIGLALPQGLMAQYSIKGRIQDAGAEPMPFANVAVYSLPDSLLTKGAVTALDGSFSIEVGTEGSYYLISSMVGYASSNPRDFQLKKGDASVELGTIILDEAAQELQEFVVAATKPLLESKPDRLVVNIQDRITATGSSVLEVLEKSPGISINRQGKSVALNGREGVQVLINGKPTQLPLEVVFEMLSGMGAEQLEKIELIHSPPASMEASGSAGVINLVTRKNENQGTNGSFSINGGYAFGEKAGANFNISHRSNRFSLYANYSFFNDRTWQNLYNDRTVIQEGENLTTHTFNDRLPTRSSHSISSGIEYHLDEKTDLGFSVSAFRNLWNLDSDNYIDIRKNGEKETYISVKSTEVNLWKNYILGGSFSRKISEKESISAHFDKLYYTNSNPSDYQNTFEGQHGTAEQFVAINKDTPIHMYVGKVDYERSLGERFQFQSGVKYLKSELVNTVSLDTDNEDLLMIEDNIAGKFQLDENISAAYFNLSWDLEKGYIIQSGLRWEHTDTQLDSDAGEKLVDRNYHDFFPTLSVHKGLKNSNFWNVSAGRRIFRPTYNQLAPFILFMDPFSFVSGNTGLKPAYTNYIQTGVRVKGAFNIQLQYSRETDYIVPWQIKTDAASNIQLAFPENIDAVNSFSLNVHFPVNLASWWEMDNSLMVNYQQSRTVFLGESLSLENRNAQASSNHTFNLPRDFTLEIAAMYRTPALMGIGIQQSMGFVNFGLQKRLKEDFGTLKFSVNDIFKTMVYGFEYDHQEVGLKQKFSMLNEMQVFRLSFSKNFGNQKAGVTKRKSASSEEQQRIQSN